jgi:hypothetical protein
MPVITDELPSMSGLSSNAVFSIINSEKKDVTYG